MSYSTKAVKIRLKIIIPWELKQNLTGRNKTSIKILNRTNDTSEMGENVFKTIGESRRAKLLDISKTATKHGNY